MKLQYSALTDVGKVREVNQDSFGVGDALPDGSQLFVVCDGMGGHLAGEVASQKAVETMLQVFRLDPNDIPGALRDGLQKANQAVLQEGRGNMGTTGVALVLYRNIAFIANVGDSRAYLLRNNELRQISVDHSLVEEQVRAGLMTREQARMSNVKNIITRAIGYQVDLQIDVFVEPVQQGDIFLLCSDGLHGFTEESDVTQIMSTPPFDTVAERLVQLANGNGGPDNITALVVTVTELDDQPMDDALLATLLDSNHETTQPIPVVDSAAATGPTGTTQMPSIYDDPPPSTTRSLAPMSSAGASTAGTRAERNLTTWGCMGALGVLLAVAALLWFFNLPPFSLLASQPTPTSQPTSSVTMIPTVTISNSTPISGTTVPLSITITVPVSPTLPVITVSPTP